MSYHSRQRRFGWLSAVAVITAAVLLLPMAPSTIAERQANVAAAEEPAKKKTDYPTIVKTVPEIGVTEVDSELKEIKVIFDRKMQKGMSWTGGPPEFPPTDSSQKARWLDDRTCVLPVKLESGTFYRLGLNSKSFQNFKCAKGVACPPTSLYFVTEGATDEIKGRVRVPEAVKLDPENGATSVDPSTTQISITFDVPMGAGMSWTGGGEDFPKSVEGKSASWSADKLTCTLPVNLEPEHQYRVGVNSLWHNNFQSESGVQVVPVEYSFKTGK